MKTSALIPDNLSVSKLLGLIFIPTTLLTSAYILVGQINLRKAFLPILIGTIWITSINIQRPSC